MADRHSCTASYLKFMPGGNLGHGSLRTITGHTVIADSQAAQLPRGRHMRHFGHIAPEVRQRLFHQEPVRVHRGLPGPAALRGPGRHPLQPGHPARGSPTTSSSRPAAAWSPWCCAWRTPSTTHEVAEAPRRTSSGSSPTSPGAARTRPAAALHPGPHPEQIPDLVRRLGPAVRLLSGFVLPKFTEERGVPFLEALVRRRGGERAAAVRHARAGVARAAATGRPASRPSRASPAPSTSTATGCWRCASASPTSAPRTGCAARPT